MPFAGHPYTLFPLLKTHLYTSFLVSIVPSVLFFQNTWHLGKCHGLFMDLRGPIALVNSNYKQPNIYFTVLLILLQDLQALDYANRIYLNLCFTFTQYWSARGYTPYFSLVHGVNLSLHGFLATQVQELNLYLPLHQTWGYLSGREQLSGEFYFIVVPETLYTGHTTEIKGHCIC